jgi:LysM repeat protein
MFSTKILLQKFAFLSVLLLLGINSFGQQKSANTRIINGKKYIIHIVEKGQSLYAIAKLYNTDINIVLAENDDAIDGLKNGQELKIPYSTESAGPTKINVIDTAKYIYHKVSKKETIYSICKQYNLSMNKMVELNPEISSGIKTGQLLIIAQKQLPVVTNTLTPKKDSLLQVSKPKKQLYNVALMLPFKFIESENIEPSQLVQSKSQFPQLQSLSVDFYMGFKKAVDSISSADFKVNILLYDIDDKDSAKLYTICRSAEFKTLDLIVGPLYPAGFKIVSAYAKTNSIPLVSPFTQQSKILYQNNFASKVNPSQFTLSDALADYCIDSLKAGSNIFVINNGVLKDYQYIKAFKQRYVDHLKELNLPLKDSVTEVRGLAGVKNVYTPGKKNVFVLLTNNQVYLADFVTQLAVYADKKDIMLAGWQNVTTFENIDQDYLNRLSYTFPSATNLNNIKTYSKLISDYQAEMSSDPGDYYFQGFDIAQYYLQNLKTIGPDFVYTLDKQPFEGNFIRYKFYRPDESTGFENRGVFIFRYNNYQLQRVQWR